MKRLIAATAAILMLSAGAASAAEVSVGVGPELQKNARAYGPREVDWLRKELAEDVQRALARRGAAPVQRVDLVIESATPNRPTFNELSAETSLSMTSIGLGGAAYSRAVSPRVPPTPETTGEKSINIIICLLSCYKKLCRVLLTKVVLCTSSVRL